MRRGDMYEEMSLSLRSPVFASKSSKFTQSINQSLNDMGVRRLWNKNGVRRLRGVASYTVHCYGDGCIGLRLKSSHDGVFLSFWKFMTDILSFCLSLSQSNVAILAVYILVAYVDDSFSVWKGKKTKEKMSWTARTLILVFLHFYFRLCGLKIGVAANSAVRVCFFPQ